MVRNELVKRSPWRILEGTTHGGLGKGNLGAIAARRGVGKTACMVHLATDQLLEGRQVIHVSFSASTSHIADWYEDIFTEIARIDGLENAMDVHDEIIRHRIIMNFNQQGVSLARVLGSVRSMIRDGHFAADLIIVDGYDFAKAGRQELQEVKRFAGELGLEIWFSVSLGHEEPRYTAARIPELLSPVIDEFAILICLRVEEQHVRLELIKDHDAPVVGSLHLELDPKTLLIARES
jgi:KaiC/GvpD/RAD55 family RecA-like ATPase